MSKKTKASKNIAFILSDRGFRYIWNKIKIPLKVILVGGFAIDSIVYGVQVVPYEGMYWGLYSGYEEYLESNKDLFALITKLNVGIILASIIILAMIIFLLLNKKISNKRKSFAMNILLVIQCVLWGILSHMTLRGAIL